MATREEFLEHLWREVIEALSRDQGLDNIIANCKRFPDDAFSGTGPAIERMLAAGVSRQDICLVMRCTAYEAVHGTLYALGDPGVDDGVDASALYEELGMTEPGTPAVTQAPRARAKAQPSSRFGPIPGGEIG